MDEIKKRVEEIEKAMALQDFWKDKDRAQNLIKELNALKSQTAGKPASAKAMAGKYDKGDAVLTIFSGAGGDDAEDWAMILFKMYQKFCAKRGWLVKILHQHQNGRGGLKNITFEAQGKYVYAILKGEAGVHRLVRISPFSAKKLRHTSFASLEVLPKLVEMSEVAINEADLKIDFARSSGPGGQNVNKRETAVRISHAPTGIVVHVESERSQAQNKERALALLRSKLYHYQKIEQQKERESLQTAKPIEAEWGHQIRSYVFHPYKLVKDHRTGIETSDVNGVLDGDLEKFIKAEQQNGFF